jgi:hypothetical protein
MTQPKYGWKFIRIDGSIMELLQRKEITATDAIILSVIHKITAKGGRCKTTNEAFAELTATSTPTASRSVWFLAKSNLIAIENGNTSARTLVSKLEDRPDQNDQVSEREEPTRPDQNDQVSKREEPTRPDQNDAVPDQNDAVPDQNDQHNYTREKQYLEKSTTSSKRGKLTSASPGDNGTDDFGTGCAKKLARTAQQATGNGAGADKVKRWASSFRRLRDDDEVREEKVVTVLDWYVENIGGEYVPTAYTGQSFREKFSAIEQAMERIDGKRIEISPEAQELADDLAELGWPKGSADQLPATVQESLDNYRAFCRQRDELRENGVDDMMKRFLRYLEQEMNFPTEFVRGWLEEVHDNVRSWDAWSGNLRAKAVRVRSKRFQQIGRDWSQNWYGNDGLWKRLMEMV